MPALRAATPHRHVVIAADTSHDQILLALIGVIGGAMAAGAYAFKRLIDHVVEAKQTAERVEHHVNSVEEIQARVEGDVRTPNGKPTLGQMVRDLSEHTEREFTEQARRIDEGFAENALAVAAIVENMHQVSRRIDANDRRIDRLEDKQ